MVLKTALISSFLVFSSLASAAQKKPAAATSLTSGDLKKAALTEATSAGVTKSTASDASDAAKSGVLTLEDPGLKERVTPWTYQLGLRVQRFAPSGRLTMSSGQEFDLGSVGPTAFPIAEFALVRQTGNLSSFETSLGLRAELGYSIQDTSVLYPSGAQPNGTRLATGLLGGSVVGLLRPLSLPKLEFEVGLGTGYVTYSHSAPDNAVNFNRQGRFNSWRVGVAYWLRPGWALDLDQSHRSLASSETFDLQSDNFSVGTRVSW